MPRERKSVHTVGEKGKMRHTCKKPQGMGSSINSKTSLRVGSLEFVDCMSLVVRGKEGGKPLFRMTTLHRISHIHSFNLKIFLFSVLYLFKIPFVFEVLTSQFTLLVANKVAPLRPSVPPHCSSNYYVL
jgi:hypothetical protein